MKKIEIKKIDTYKSSIFEDKTITEYIIYYLEDNVRKAAFTEFGETAKDARVKKIIDIHFKEILS